MQLYLKKYILEGLSWNPINNVVQFEWYSRYIIVDFIIYKLLIIVFIKIKISWSLGVI